MTRHNPAHLLTQTDRPVLKPELPYEKTGQYAAGTTFAEGLVFFHEQVVSVLRLRGFAGGGGDCSGGGDECGVAAASDPPATGGTCGREHDGNAAGAEANARGFYLHNGDTVVFYGDSITEQNYYNQWVELYTATRFPWMRVHFYGAGVGGDRVTGGGGGPIDQRLERDVFSEKPTVVTRDAGDE